MKKVVKFFLDNSSALLIFITILTLAFIINISLKSSNRAGKNLLHAVSLFTHSQSTDAPPSPEEVKAMLQQFNGEYFSSNNAETNNLIEALSSDPSSVDSHILLQFITGYQQLIDERLRGFDSLIFFLVAAIIIQFIIQLFTSRRSQLKGRQLENSKDVLRLLSREREKERLKISSFLHDSILQDIGNLLMTPEMRKTNIAAGRLREISGSLRELTYQITPLQLHTNGLKDSLSELADEYQKISGLRISCSVNGFKESFLDNESRLVFFRIIQEALNNIIIDDEAKNVKIKLVASHPYLILRIKDDGKRYTKNQDSETHLEMSLIKQKAKSLGASISGESAAGLGTTITLKYPMNQKA